MPTPWSRSTPEERDAIQEVTECVSAFENGIGRDFKERCEKFYRQYRGFQKFRNAWEKAGPNDRDGVVLDAKKTWGANLHIPLSFRTIETMVPRAIAQRPRMLYLPRDPKWEDNVENVRLLIDSQQEQIDIDLEFQDVMRTGMIYGLGVGKSFWRTEYAPRRKVRPRLLRPNSYVVGDPVMDLVFDDPDFENVDVFDFLWDGFADSTRHCEWIVHRTWLSLAGCLTRIENGAWNTDAAKLLTEDELRSMGSGQKYDEIWQQRMEASGFSSFHQSTRGEHIHEVWEWHDGVRVYTVLDRQVLVQDAENPCYGHMPFHVYRPTKLPKQMVGIGEIEPVEHLQRELDTLRSQRRDAATLALCAGYAYDDTIIDEEDLVFGPAAAIRVGGDPSRALMPLQIKQVPGSGYQEEQVIRGDFDSVTGVNDALAGGDGGQISTATEAQLVQAALSKRVELKSRRFEIEVAKDAGRAWLYLNQRMIVTNRKPIRQPADGLGMLEAAQAGRWQWFRVGPGEIRGEFEIVPEGGSMAAENVPQNRQDGAQIMSLFGQNPYVDPVKPLLKALALFGVKDPESWLKQTDPPVPPMAIELLKRVVDPALVDRVVAVAQANDPMLNPEGPDQGQVAQMMGDQGAGTEAAVSGAPA